MLAALGLNCNRQDLYVQHVGSNSLNRSGTRAPALGVSSQCGAPGPPGKSSHQFLYTSLQTLVFNVCLVFLLCKVVDTNMYFLS